MPLLQMKEMVTPLKLIGIKLFKCNEGHLYVKLWSRPRKRIFG